MENKDLFGEYGIIKPEVIEILRGLNHEQLYLFSRALLAGYRFEEALEIAKNYELGKASYLKGMHPDNREKE